MNESYSRTARVSRDTIIRGEKPLQFLKGVMGSGMARLGISSPTKRAVT